MLCPTARYIGVGGVPSCAPPLPHIPSNMHIGSANPPTMYALIRSPNSRTMKGKLFALLSLFQSILLRALLGKHNLSWAFPHGTRSTVFASMTRSWSLQRCSLLVCAQRCSSS